MFERVIYTRHLINPQSDKNVPDCSGDRLMLLVKTDLGDEGHASSLSFLLFLFFLFLPTMPKGRLTRPRVWRYMLRVCSCVLIDEGLGIVVEHDGWSWSFEKRVA